MYIFELFERREGKSEIFVSAQYCRLWSDYLVPDCCDKEIITEFFRERCFHQSGFNAYNVKFDKYIINIYSLPSSISNGPLELLKRNIQYKHFVHKKNYVLLDDPQ